MINFAPPPLLLQIEDLALVSANTEVLLIAVCQAEVFKARHIPDSVLIEPAELVSGHKPAVGKLPSLERLTELFSRIGLNEDKHVVVYDDEGGGWAGRLIWTLDILGHTNYSNLDGGLVAWLKAGYPLEQGAGHNVASQFQAHLKTELLVSMEQIIQRLDDPQLKIWDARSTEEFNGTKITALRNGHIPGAANLDWLQLMDRENDLRLLPLDQLASRLDELGIRKGRSIITHCQTHHRSGLTYLVGKLLGLDIKAYDGSWSEWGNHPDTPIEC